MADKQENQTAVSVENTADREDDSVVHDRRALLKSAVVTMPMILTLQSGAALARSSNLISASRPRSAMDSDGRMLCMDYRYIDSELGDHDLVDLGEPPYASVTAISKRKYYDAPYGEEVHRREMCREGGTYYYKRSYWRWRKTGYVPRGMLVSATALSSFAGHIDITEI